MQHSPLAYLNGVYLPFEELKLPVYDLGIVQGATVTERLRTFHQQPHLVQEHLQRLANSLTALGLNVQLVSPLQDVIQKLVEENSSLLAAGQDLAVVIFITAGSLVSDSNGLLNTSTPTVCAYTTPLSGARWISGYEQGVHLITPNVRQIPRDSIPPQIKMRSRLHWYLADQEARQQDPNAMAILLDHSEHLTETSSGNLFIVTDGQLLTPTEETTLTGISQNFVISLAIDLGLTVTRKDLCAEDLSLCQEAFLTSSTYCILPVTRFNTQRIGSGMPGDMTQQLTRLWVKTVGLDFVQQAKIQSS